MTIWCHRYITGDLTLIADVQERIDQVHGTKSLLSHTVVSKEESDAKLAEAHALTIKYHRELAAANEKIAADDIEKTIMRNKLHQVSLLNNRKRKHDQVFCAKVNKMNKTGAAIQRDLLQTDDSRTTPSSMSARFIALLDVDHATNGKDNKVAHALIKDTLWMLTTLQTEKITKWPTL